MLELAKEDQDLYDELDFLINTVIDQEKGEDEENIENLRFFFFFFQKKGEIESNFLSTPFGGLNWNHYLVQYGFDPMIQFGLVSKCGLKVTSISHFVTKVPLVALKLILSNSLCILT